MADKYRPNWIRAPVRRVLASVPIYMLWDDHDIRDGWGSEPADSPTLAARYPRGREIHAQFVAFFEDARDVYWHFQRVLAPLPGDIPDPGVDNYVGAAAPWRAPGDAIRLPVRAPRRSDARQPR